MAVSRYRDWDELLAAMQRFEFFFTPAILAVSAGYIFLKGWRFVLLMRPVTDVSWSGMVAGAAAILLPGGVAARAGLMSQAGVPWEKCAAPVAWSRILDQAVCGRVLGGIRSHTALIFFGLLVAFGLLLLVPSVWRWFRRAAEWVAKKLRFPDRWQQFLSALTITGNTSGSPRYGSAGWFRWPVRRGP